MFVDEGGSGAHRAVLLAEAKDAAEYGLACLRLALGELETDGDLGAAYTPAFTSDEAHARALLAAIGQGWDAAVAAARDITHDRLGMVRGYEDKAFQEYIKGLRKGWRDAADRIQTRLLAVDSEKEAHDRALVAPAMLALVRTVRAFGKAFADEKLRRGVVDFGDLEHFAVRLLIKDGRPTGLAKTVAAGFDEIMVDEYQDTNAVQEAIFGAVSREGRNLFFVGDVKQSIYGFRLANPYIFLSKYRAWPDADCAAPGEPRRLNLTRNFRSRAQVLDATNDIFRRVMCEAVGDLDYTDREALYVGADYPQPGLKVISSGLSYLRQWSPHLAAAELTQGVCSLAGFGRQAFAYPEFPNDIFQRGALDPKKCCITCGKCTELMRAGSTAGCVIRDPVSTPASTTDAAGRDT